jgi:hypothetical protein
MVDLSYHLSNTKSSRIFNRIRQEQSRRGPSTFIDVSLSERDLTSFNLSAARFTKCYFEDVQFGPIENAEFADCRFKSCRFDDTSSGRRQSLRLVLFYLCVFEETHFENSHLRDIQFAKTGFLTPPKFSGSKARGTIRIDKSGGWATFRYLPDLDLKTSWSTVLRAELPTPSRWRFSWETVRTLQHIPFLQTSLIGLLLLVTQLSFVEFYVHLASEPQSACKALLSQVKVELSGHPGLAVALGQMEDALNSWCGSLSATRFTRGTLISIGESTVMFVVLFFASLIHKVRGPSEVYEYSTNQWVIEHARPELYYKIIARRNAGSLFLAGILYAISLAMFSHLFVSKLAFIYNLLWR